MDTSIANVIAELRVDHRNMANMLKILENEANRIYAGEDPDVELLDDVMYYMTVYPDVVHHPKEDRVYAEVKAVRPDLASGFRRIAIDHQQIEDMGVVLRRDVRAINSDQIVRRDAIVSDIFRYVCTLRGHMQWEELDLFRRVDQMVADGHEFLDAAIFVHNPDPAFGPTVEKRFETLLARVANHTHKL